MMFMQFFIWGAWYATAGNYMRSAGLSDVIYLAYMASPIGSIVAPFFMGMIADRFFPVQTFCQKPSLQRVDRQTHLPRRL